MTRMTALVKTYDKEDFKEKIFFSNYKEALEKCQKIIKDNNFKSIFFWQLLGSEILDEGQKHQFVQFYLEEDFEDFKLFKQNFFTINADDYRFKCEEYVENSEEILNDYIEGVKDGSLTETTWVDYSLERSDSLDINEVIEDLPDIDIEITNNYEYPIEFLSSLEDMYSFVEDVDFDIGINVNEKLQKYLENKNREF